MEASNASKPLRVGLVGCGSVALVAHIPAFKALRDPFQVVAVADPTPSLRAQAQESLGLASGDAYPSHEPVIARADIDMIAVCTPPNVRREIVTAAARAGKHILSEKPLATVPKDAEAMVGAARAAGVKLGLVHNYLFRPEFVAARSLLDAGEIGVVEVAILNYLGVLDNPGSSEYQPGWRHRSGVAGGGVLMDMMHVVYVAEFLLGAPIRRVSAYVDAREPGSPVEDLALCRFESETNVALVNLGWGFGPGGVQVSGTEGRLVIHNREDGTSPFYPPQRISVVGRSGERLEDVSDRADDHRLALAEFGTAVLRGNQPVASGEDGRRVLEAVLAAYQSAVLERPISLPLDRDDPVFLRGVAGLDDLVAPSTSRPLRQQIFGLGRRAAAGDAVMNVSGGA